MSSKDRSKFALVLALSLLWAVVILIEGVLRIQTFGSNASTSELVILFVKSFLPLALALILKSSIARPWNIPKSPASVAFGARISTMILGFGLLAGLWFVGAMCIGYIFALLIVVNMGSSSILVIAADFMFLGICLYIVTNKTFRSGIREFWNQIRRNI